MGPILLTAFEPFDGAATNPSREVAELVAGKLGCEVHVHILPVSFERAPRALRATCEEVDPSLVLGLGLASNRTAVSFERLAVNLADARIPDNDGVRPAGEELIPGAAIAHWTNLPVKAAAAAVRGQKVELSMTAGTYVCNAVFYHAMEWAGPRARRAGFVHVPRCVDPAELRACAGAVETLVHTTTSGITEVRLPFGDIS